MSEKTFMTIFVIFVETADNQVNNIGNHIDVNQGIQNHFQWKDLIFSQEQINDFDNAMDVEKAISQTKSE